MADTSRAARDRETIRRLTSINAELLEALVGARRCLAWASEQRREFEAEYDLANAAIAKATGEQP